MKYWSVAVSMRLAHHLPSLYQSLLSGFEPLGDSVAPANDGPSHPMSPGLAAAAVDACWAAGWVAAADAAVAANPVLPSNSMPLSANATVSRRVIPLIALPPSTHGHRFSPFARYKRFTLSSSGARLTYQQVYGSFDSADEPC